MMTIINKYYPGNNNKKIISMRLKNEDFNEVCDR